MTNPDLAATLNSTAATHRAIEFATTQLRFALITARTRAIPQDDLTSALLRAADALHVAESLSRDAQ